MKARDFFAATGRSDQDSVRIADLIALEEIKTGGKSEKATTETGGEGGGPTAHRTSGRKPGKKK